MAATHDRHSSIPSEMLVYESSNGDKWYLCENPETGLPAVKHSANAQSGGHVSYRDVENFLSSGAGPEHEALKKLLKQDHLATILIASTFTLAWAQLMMILQRPSNP